VQKVVILDDDARAPEGVLASRAEG
jgi:hypothetical protein